MVVLKKLDTFSAAKIGALVYLLVGLVEAALALFFSATFHSIFNTSLSHPVLGLASVVVTPIVALIVGFFGVLVVAALYNFVARRFGGIKLELKGSELKSIDPVSVGKVAAIIAAVIGLVIGVVLGVIVGAVAWASGAGAFGAVLAVGIIIVYPIVSAVIVFILEMLVALVYNFIASKIGGVDLYFKGKELRSVGAISYAKIEGVFGAIIGLIYGLIFAAIFSLAGSVPGMSSGAMSVVLRSIGPLAIVLFPIGLGIIAFLSAGFEAMVYNWAANSIGGVKIVLGKK